MVRLVCHAKDWVLTLPRVVNVRGNVLSLVGRPLSLWATPLCLDCRFQEARPELLISEQDVLVLLLFRVSSGKAGCGCLRLRLCHLHWVGLAEGNVAECLLLFLDKSCLCGSWFHPLYR